jgi:hypothetical protein
MRLRRAPIECAARTYSASRSTSTRPRTSRAVSIQPTIESAKTTAQIVIARWSSATMMTMLIGSRGSASNPSTARIRTASTRPPARPETAP